MPPEGSVSSRPVGGGDGLPSPRFPGAHQLLHQISTPAACPCGRTRTGACLSPVNVVSRCLTAADGPPTSRTRGLPSREHDEPLFVKLTQPTSDPVAPLKKTPRCGSTVPTWSCERRQGGATGGTWAITVRSSHAPVRSPLRDEPPRKRDEPVPPPARGQSRGLAPVGRRGVRARPRRGQAAARLDRLLRVPLVPRDGARVVRGRGDGADDERPLRLREGRPRGAARRRRRLHGRGGRAVGAGRLADDRVRHAGRRAVLRRHVLPAGAAPRHARVPAGARRGRGGVPGPARGRRRGRPRCSSTRCDRAPRRSRRRSR